MATSQNNEDISLAFEKSNYTKTATYPEILTFYKNLETSFHTIKIMEIGTTDAGYPLHLIIYNKEATFDFENLKKEKAILLINNGIHPGEPDGIDATMLLFRNLAQNKIKVPKNTIVAAIAVYNIGGALQRNNTSRVNQDGPEEYGFRGNARNFDLNRDFIKSDTKNTEAFAQIFHLLNPDVFMDTHVSNGADYQYTLTHLFTQHNKLGGKLGNYLNDFINPELEARLAKENWDITPYVNVFNSPPEKGFSQFMDSPRYSTGYTTLFHTFGMMIETHMLKPYKNRVEGTYAILQNMIAITDENFKEIKQLRSNYFSTFTAGTAYPIQWEIDSTKTTTLNFKGFESSYKPSKVTGKERLLYDREKPFTKPVSYFDYFKPAAYVTIPKAYGIPKGWWNVIALLQKNQIQMQPIKKDTVLTAEVYKIKKYATRNTAFEGHYSHYNTTISKKTEEIMLHEGDYLVYTNQPGVRYLLETLEPEAVDSFFNWNFFDTILQQKEGFSPYVFEEIAEKLLQEKLEIKARFDLKKVEEIAFRENWYAQLDWLYMQSKHYEKAHLRYPILRLMN
ncbi:MAG: hypothetical protein CVU03_12310 [Bacteroidetes bacterium HGW-Bacteroidetes-2]|jgi:hypothetical protein|nr:MAG: hypothetical protein CVU03_12310 [Bacteroidetes bacterium HGW-Bacteroidetes-2]